uniref:Uncharacterized protein n=1 Tax=Timema cristinae TaxID=61476 RepID=A0A7R9CD26_TIMCR|nr:unnamed protein product [Timema cristinae]
MGTFQTQTAGLGFVLKGREGCINSVMCALHSSPLGGVNKQTAAAWSSSHAMPVSTGLPLADVWGGGGWAPNYLLRSSPPPLTHKRQPTRRRQRHQTAGQCPARYTILESCCVISCYGDKVQQKLTCALILNLRKLSLSLVIASAKLIQFIVQNVVNQAQQVFNLGPVSGAKCGVPPLCSLLDLSGGET